MGVIYSFTMNFFNKNQRTLTTEEGKICSFFQKEDIKKMSKEIIKPIVNIIYDEIYPYIWFLCIYNVFLLFITLSTLFLIVRFLNKKGNECNGYNMI